MGVCTLRVRTVKGMSNLPALEVCDLVVEYSTGKETVRAVDHASFSALPGAVTAVVGPNGAGKTSSIEACEGYRSSYQGLITVLGMHPLRDHSALTHRMGVMLQGGGIYPSARVEETVRHFCALYDDAIDPLCLIEQVGLAGLERRTWRALSGGEKQRLSFALAMSGQPDIVFLDEPTAGVDIDGREMIRALLRQLAERGCAVILATHELDEAERCADDVVVFDGGKVVHQSSLSTLLGAARQIRFTTSSTFDEASLAADIGLPITRRDETYVVEGSSDTALISRIESWLAGIDVLLTGVQAGGRRLEDAVRDLRKKDIP